MKPYLNILYRILNEWLVFSMLLFCLSCFPHWSNISFHAWFNVSLYFILFLTSSKIFRFEHFNKDVFLNMSIYFLLYTISFINIFIGKDYLLGDDYFVYYFIHYKKIILAFFFHFTIFFITIKYLFNRLNTFYLYLISFLIQIIILNIIFIPYITNINYIFYMGENYKIDIYKRLLSYNILSFFIIVFYAYRVIKKDIIIGEYFHELMISFFLFISTEIVNDLSEIFNFQIFSITQYIITINLLFLIRILFKKLKFIQSDYGQFYELLIQNKIKLGSIKIIRYHNDINIKTILIIKEYLIQRKIHLIFGILIYFFFLIGINAPLLLIIDSVIILLLCSIIFLFLCLLYKKREKNQYLLPKEQNKIVKDNDKINRDQSGDLEDSEDDPRDLRHQ